MSGGVVADAAGFVGRPAAGVEMVFRDVDADGRVGHSFRCPMLVMRASRSGFRSGLREGRGAIKLSNGPIGPAVVRSDPSPPPEGSYLRRRHHPAAARLHRTDKQSSFGQQAEKQAKKTMRAPARTKSRQRPRPEPSARARRRPASWRRQPRGGGGLDAPLRRPPGRPGSVLVAELEPLAEQQRDDGADRPRQQVGADDDSPKRVARNSATSGAKPAPNSQARSEVSAEAV